MSDIKQTALSISIALVMLLFIHYAIATFYPEPKSDCGLDHYPRNYRINESCPTSITEEEQQCINDKGNPVYNYTTGCPVFEKCDFCYNEYREQRETYDRNVFILSSVIGIVAILFGTLRLTLESVSTGIMGGGVLSVIYGTIRYWEYAENAMKLVALGIVLSILIWIGYKKMRR